MEDAAATLQSDRAPVRIDRDIGSEACLHFLLYPANVHHLILSGDQMEQALADITPAPTARIVLAACQPTYPPLEEGALNDLASSKLNHISKKNVIRALEPNDLQSGVENHMRHALRQLGVSAPEADRGQNINEISSSLISYEAQSWRI